MIKENYISILKTFFIALVVFTIGSIIGVRFIPPALRYLMNMAFFILIVFSLFSRKGGFISNRTSLYGYAFILGILTGSTYVYYFYYLGSNIFLSCVLGVLLIFGISYMIAERSSEQAIYKLTPMIWGGLIALLILELINIFFFRFGTYDLILSTGGILIYSLYAIYIMKSIQQRCRYGLLSESEIAQLTYSVFISFLNLLLDILRLMSIVQRDRD